ncbi:40S ribosomal protein S10 [Perkinsela sp. CCAP 1560/4]|nr:40S ribosomal protein S10 [Perkinsela sp. CCAP 1560/4]|eukprot:KNH09209.1 40S ribosomal protein S10 [Perkinsela sp. CCAP 1560/4]
MFIPRKNRDEILMELFTDGVMVCKKEFGKHLKLNVSNLEVINLMRSFKAKKYVDEVYVWHHFYWTLTEAGIEYIRKLLYIKPNIVPNTMKAGVRENVDISREGARGVRSHADAGRGRGRAYGQA